MASDFAPLETVIRQYSSSPKIKALIWLWWQAITLNTFENDFYTNIWDLDTCNKQGLNIWGKIVNLSRTMSYSTSSLFFGFEEAMSDPNAANNPQPFNTYPFYSKQFSTTENIVLSDQYYRKAIYLKAMTNITDCTIPAINKALMYVFGDSGTAWVQLDDVMKISYHFDFTPETAELAMIQNGDLLPRPCGYVVSYIFEGNQ